MSTEKPQALAPVTVIVPEHALALLREYRELEQQWLDVPDGSPESQALGAQLKPLRMKLVIWLNTAGAQHDRNM